MTAEQPSRYVSLPLGDEMIFVKRDGSGEIRWDGHGASHWALTYSSDFDGIYRLEISCEHSILLSEMDLDKVFTTVRRVIESGMRSDRTPLDFRLSADITA